MKPMCTLMAGALLAGCSATRDVSETPRYDEFTGEPVQMVQYTQLVQWRPLGDDAVLLQFERNRHFVLTVMQPCLSDTREATTLRLRPASGRRLSVLDRVLLDDRECRIESLRPLDKEAWRETADADR